MTRRVLLLFVVLLINFNEYPSALANVVACGTKESKCNDNVVMAMSEADTKAVAQVKFDKSLQDDRKEKTYLNNLKINYDIPLPNGEWHEITTEDKTVNTVILRRVNLFKIDDKSLQASMSINANLNGGYLKWNDEPCKVTDYLYKNDYGTSLYDQRCLTIRPTTFLQSNNENQENMRGYLSKNKIKNSFNSIQVKITQYTHTGKFLQIELYLFPDNNGLDNPLVSILTTSPWSKSNYTGDPQKIRFIEDLAAWAEIYSNTVYQQFSESKNIVARLPEFIFPSTTKPNEAVNKSVSIKLESQSKSISTVIDIEKHQSISKKETSKSNDSLKSDQAENKTITQGSLAKEIGPNTRLTMESTPQPSSRNQVVQVTSNPLDTTIKADGKEVWVNFTPSITIVERQFCRLIENFRTENALAGC